MLKEKRKKKLKEGVMGLITPEALRITQLAGLPTPNTPSVYSNSQPQSDKSELETNFEQITSHINSVQELLFKLNVVDFRCAISHLEDVIRDAKSYDEMD